MADALSIGLSALLAQQRAMEVTSHNIANLSNPAYSRQGVDLTTNIPEERQPGQIGSGVRVISVKRTSDAFITEQLRSGMTESGNIDYINQVMQGVQGIFNEPSDTGLSAAVNQVFSALQDLSNNPESVGVRNTTINELANFTNIIKGMGAQLDQTKSDLEGQLSIEVGHINNLTEQIADLNRDIRFETAVGNNPNDLLDRREKLINDLSSLINVNVRIDPQTQVANVQAGSRLIVDGDTSMKVEAGSSLDRISLLAGDTGETLAVSGGRVGAIIELASERIPAVIAQIDGFVQSLVGGINAIHTVGTNGNSQIGEFVGETLIAGSDFTTDLDDPSLVLGDDGEGIAAAFAPSFTDANGVSQVRNLTVNIRDSATGIAQKYIIRYDPGVGPVSTTRSLKDLIDAVNTGTGGGFTVYGPSGVATPIANLTASALQVSSGLRLDLKAATGYSVDFSRALDTRPSAEPLNAATWTAGSPAVDLRGRYTGSLPYNPAAPWTMQVISGGTVGDNSAPPVVRFSWYDDPTGVAVPRTTDVTLDADHAGKPITIGAGVQAFIASGVLVTGDSLNMKVDGSPDQAGLLSALGINTLLSGSRASTIAVSAAVAADPGRLAVSNTRVAGDNSNVLAMATLRQNLIFDGNTKNAADFVASMASGIGSQVELSKRLGENQDILAQALQNRREQVSGVNIDEEVGTLIKQQQAYTAAARIITSMQDNIRTLMDLIR